MHGAHATCRCTRSPSVSQEIFKAGEYTGMTADSGPADADVPIHGGELFPKPESRLLINTPAPITTESRAANQLCPLTNTSATIIDTMKTTSGQPVSSRGSLYGLI